MKSLFDLSGVAYILFASKEPNFFIAFQNPSKDPIRRFQEFLPMKDHSYQLVLDSIVADYPLTLEEASRLYQHLFIYSHGMASMVASGIYQFSMEESDWFIDRSLSISHQRNGGKK